jgi:hypothetical protein
MCAMMDGYPDLCSTMGDNCTYVAASGTTAPVPKRLRKMMRRLMQTIAPSTTQVSWPGLHTEASCCCIPATAIS